MRFRNYETYYIQTVNIFTGLWVQILSDSDETNLQQINVPLTWKIYFIVYIHCFIHILLSNLIVIKWNKLWVNEMYWLFFFFSPVKKIFLKIWIYIFFNLLMEENFLTTLLGFVKLTLVNNIICRRVKHIYEISNLFFRHLTCLIVQ